MAKVKGVKSAIIASILSLTLCIALFAGSTFAWFSDTVKSKANTLTAGNLKVELTHTDATVTGELVTEEIQLFDDVALWEPSAMSYENLTVTNKGSLSLTYKLSIVLDNVVSVNGKSLAQALHVAVHEGGFVGTGENGAITRADVEGLDLTYTPLAEFEVIGEYDLYPNGTEGQISAKTYGVAIKWISTASDNEYNVDGTPLTLDIGVDLVAKQLMYEEDSFGSDFDGESYYPADVWDGSSDTSWYDASLTSYEISTAAQLAGLAQIVNEGVDGAAVSFEGKTITLTNDIDLNNINWNPIGRYWCEAYAKTAFDGTFDGDGHTIYNLKSVTALDGAIANNSAALFGGAIGAKVINLNIKGAYVQGYSYVAVVIGYVLASTIENCTVMDADLVSLHVNDDACGDKTGVLIGNHVAEGAGAVIGNTIRDCTVTTGGRDAGQLAGCSAQITYSNNVVDNVTVSYVEGLSVEGYGGTVCNHSTAGATDRIRNYLYGRENSQNVVEDNNVDGEGNVITAPTT